MEVQKSEVDAQKQRVASQTTIAEKERDFHIFQATNFRFMSKGGEENVPRLEPNLSQMPGS